MLQFNVDKDLCIKCGECVNDCPYMILDMVDEYPVVNPDRAEMCIQCQHCLAVCKPGALSIFGLNPADSRSLKGNLPDPVKVENLLLGRRSTRRYKQEPVDSELLDSILETVRMAPTGMNRRTTLLTVVDNLEVMEKVRASAYAELKAAVDADQLPPEMELFKGISDAYETKGIDVLFRGAPHFLVTSAPTENRSGTVDGIIAMTYFEMLANSHGIGTVWDGLAKWSMTMVAPKTIELLGIPADHEVSYMMAFGKPAVKYHRTVQRPGGGVNKVTS
ncbi:nitroreductase family protein [Pseudodesulfovibrio sp. zrk46]|uniref:nitroreductase family protein n=1 Tax=Pseudodesulfovibrio sp. zrk46 TaxID=2725288 RepID=UPI001449CD6D|nr:nitroreductase family protein [Pseudodesulfovibrio sp. zrk46]QJB55819.1 4Fe-4S binding protein [Pseudodesulfovibrio sp. zrk46]